MRIPVAIVRSIDDARRGARRLEPADARDLLMTATADLAAALDPLLLYEIEEHADRCASYWRSIAEAASRGEAMTVAVHLRQARLVTANVAALVKRFGEEGTADA